MLQNGNQLKTFHMKNSRHSFIVRNIKRSHIPAPFFGELKIICWIFFSPMFCWLTRSKIRPNFGYEKYNKNAICFETFCKNRLANRASPKTFSALRHQWSLMKFGGKNTFWPWWIISPTHHAKHLWCNTNWSTPYFFLVNVSLTKRVRTSRIRKNV